MGSNEDYAGLSRNWPDYQIGQRLGKGGYGKVYELNREKNGIKMQSAVKVIHIPSPYSSDDEYLWPDMSMESRQAYYHKRANDCMMENKLMESLKGAAHIVTIEDCVMERAESGIGYTIYIKMERLESLTEVMKNYPFEDLEIARLGKEICEALIACEQRNIIHRDIKPANIFMNSFGDYKLGDFGIAKQMIEEQASMTQIGTAMYMSPEIFLGKKADMRADIYSLGIMLYKIANHGLFPFVSKNDISPEARSQAQYRRMKGDRLPLPTGVDPELGSIILKACEYRPHERFKNASVFKDALEYWMYKKKKPEVLTPKIPSNKTDSIKIPAGEDSSSHISSRRLLYEEWAKQVQGGQGYVDPAANHMKQAQNIKPKNPYEEWATEQWKKPH